MKIIIMLLLVSCSHQQIRDANWKISEDVGSSIHTTISWVTTKNNPMPGDYCVRDYYNTDCPAGYECFQGNEGTGMCLQIPRGY
jgi:hypothetical protein